MYCPKDEEYYLENGKQALKYCLEDLALDLLCSLWQVFTFYPLKCRCIDKGTTISLGFSNKKSTKLSDSGTVGVFIFFLTLIEVQKLHFIVLDHSRLCIPNRLLFPVNIAGSNPDDMFRIS